MWPILKLRGAKKKKSLLSHGDILSQLWCFNSSVSPFFYMVSGSGLPGHQPQLARPVISGCGDTCFERHMARLISARYLCFLPGRLLWLWFKRQVVRTVWDNPQENASRWTYLCTLLFSSKWEMSRLNLGWVLWDWTGARGFQRARGLALEGQEPVSFPSSPRPQLLNQRREEGQIPSRAWFSSHPARTDRLYLPACSLSLTQTHTEHSSWETSQVSCWLCSKETSKFIALPWQGCRFVLTSLFFFPHTPLTCCLFLNCSPHEWVQMRSVSVIFIPPPIHCIILSVKERHLFYFIL